MSKKTDQQQEPSQTHLSDHLQTMRVDELRTAARTIGIKLPTGAKKEALCKALATSLITEADAVLDGLTVFELRMLTQILDNGGSKRYPVYYENVFSLSRMRVVNVEFVEKENKDEDGIESLFTVPQELVEAFSPIIRQILADKEQDGYEPIEQAAGGLLAIYGTMPFDKLIEQLTILFPERTEGQLRLFLKRKYLYKGHSPYWEDKNAYAASPFLGDIKNGVFFDRSFWGLPDEYKPAPDKSVIMRYGQQPIPDICSDGAEELRQVYKEVYGESEGEDRFMSMWYEIQPTPLRMAIEKILQELCETEEDITPELVNVIKRFLNHIPRWSMYGYTVSDRALKSSVSKEQAERKMDNEYRSHAKEISQQQSSSSLLDLSATNPYWNGQKIGRNDLCPCGSGLKFKKCHGKS